MRKKITAVAILCCSAQAYAAPVFLDCRFLDGETIHTFSVTLDEATNKITHTREGGSAFNAEGFFAASTITYQTISVGDLTTTNKYEINRSSLALTYIFNVEVTDPVRRLQLPGSTLTYSGSCDIAETPERKI